MNHFELNCMQIVVLSKKLIKQNGDKHNIFDIVTPPATFVSEIEHCC